jgi:protein involved in plasmid replication-relaxation
VLSASYVEAHRYDGAVVQHDRRDAIVPCVVQPRDLAIVEDVWRYKFLTAPQLLELWWPDTGGSWPGQRRLRKLFDAGYLERFRPLARRGSYPWTYHLGHAGHQLLQRAGVVPRSQRYYARTIYDFGHVLHELQLNAWVLAFRRATQNALLAWHGELNITPPRDAAPAQMPFPGDWSAEDLRNHRARLLRPDAVLELAREGSDEVSIVLVEFDRTGRVDKNYDKFRRYDAFLCWWWRHSAYGAQPSPPLVLFVCQTSQQRQQFLTAADHELTGHHWHPSADHKHHDYVGRRQLLFALEHDAHAGALEAWQLPRYPPGHPARDPAVQRVPIAG